ncbi:MAG: MBL fold metallo-hydrolase [Deltaproteobacteria bacterium]|nr:MBL fold metallo-hydrolase [Deltaproteobacteria bacterium]
MNPGEMIQVQGPVWLLVGQKRGNFPFCHGVVIKDQGVTALLDPGCGPLVLEPLAASGGVDLVINSHTHPDHCAGNHFFVGSEILIPQAAWEFGGSKVKLSERLAEPGHLAAIWREFVTRSMGFEDFQPTGNFVPGQEIKIGSTVLEVVGTPGHTADHCCFWLPQHGILLSADIDLTSFGPFYGHRESSLEQVRASVEIARGLRPRLLVSAHRMPLSQDLDQAMDKYLSVLDKRDQSILKFLSEERSVPEMVEASPIYGGHNSRPDLTRYWEGRMIQKHLNLLETKGLVQATADGYLATGDFVTSP